MGRDVSLSSSCSVALVSLTLQWLIYKDWLHNVGLVRFVGTVWAELTTFFLVWHWHEGIRCRRIDTQRRLEIIAEMNDRIRNALEAIECITYVEGYSTLAAVMQLKPLMMRSEALSRKFNRPSRNKPKP